jgi:hypothetical protein
MKQQTEDKINTVGFAVIIIMIAVYFAWAWSRW